MSIIRSKFKYRNDNVVLFLIGINIGVFVFQQIIPSVTFFAAMNPTAVLNGYIWQFVTYMFAHGGITHLLFNMLGLFIFGTQVEREMGSKEFLLYYMLTGFLAGIFSFFVYLFTGSYWVFLLGASGAIFAVQLAYATFFPHAVIYIWGILPLKAPIMVLGFTALAIISQFTGLQRGVAHLTHLAGFGFGWLYFLVRFRENPWHSLTGRR